MKQFHIKAFFTLLFGLISSVSISIVTTTKNRNSKNVFIFCTWISFVLCSWEFFRQGWFRFRHSQSRRDELKQRNGIMFYLNLRWFIYEPFDWPRVHVFRALIKLSVINYWVFLFPERKETTLEIRRVHSTLSWTLWVPTKVTSDRMLPNTIRAYKVNYHCLEYCQLKIMDSFWVLSSVLEINPVQNFQKVWWVTLFINFVDLHTKCLQVLEI